MCQSTLQTAINVQNYKIIQIQATKTHYLSI